MSKSKGVSAERIARRLLESRGFKIVSFNHDIMDDGERVAEIDIVAESKSGEVFAVEVKAGNGDVQSIRQAYGNAKLSGFRPMLICKGFSDESARLAAEKLNVEVVKLSEYYLLLEPEELEGIVKKCVEEVFETHGFFPYSVDIKKNDRKVLEAIADSRSFNEAAERLDMDRKKLGRAVGGLTGRGVLPRRSLSFRDLKRVCSSVLSRMEIIDRLERIEEKLDESLIK